MTTTNKQTAAIWAEKLGDAYVGCYGLLDDLDREDRGQSPVRLSLSPSSFFVSAWLRLPLTRLGIRQTSTFSRSRK